MPSRSVLAGVLFCVASACSGHHALEPTTGTVPMPAFAVSQQIASTDQTQVPWSLTASDGSGLVLTRVDAKAVFEGPLAFTELHLYFHNPEDRIREGKFAITLPAHAAVSRFAMENNGQWMEAEVVEKRLARRAYEDFLHRRQDPALLEKAEGNQFTARVFPIPASGDKHIVISFSQELPGERYVLPLRGLPKVDRVDVRMTLLDRDGHRSDQLLTQRSWVPDRDFVSAAPVAAEAIASGNVIAAQIPVLDRSGAMPAPETPSAVTILVDTSASRTLGFATTVAKLDALVGELRRRHGDNLPLQVVAFDQDTRAMFSGRAADWSDAQRRALLSRGAAGASDLGQAIDWLAAHGTHARLVVFGDGVITAGAKADGVEGRLAKLAKAGKLERVDVVLSGGIRDEQGAGELVRAASHAGAVLDLDVGAETVVAALGERMLTDVAIDVPGASWVYPRTIASARPGSRVMVYAKLPLAMQAANISVNGHTRSVPLVAGTRPLIERAAAAAEIAELETELERATGAAAKALRIDIAKRSVAARVVSSQTSLLVLESDADYARYGIDRASLADILEIGPNGIVTRNRAGAVPVQIAKPPVVTTKRPAKNKGNDGSKDGKATLAADDGRLDADDKKEEKTAQKQLEDQTPSVDIADVTTSHEAPKPDENAPAAEPTGSTVTTGTTGMARGEGNRGSQGAAAPPPPPRAVRPIPARRTPAVSRVGDGPVQQMAAEDDDRERDEDQGSAWPPKDKPAPLQGELAEIAGRIAHRDLRGALGHARTWHQREPGNVLAWVGLGEALEASGDFAQAARAYGSIIDLFPGRADLRRFAGERLERIASQAGPKAAAAARDARELAIDTYQRAAADRPDHLTGHRLLAYALLRAGKHAEAFAEILRGIAQPYPAGRFDGGDRILREDAGLIGAAYAAAVPAKRQDIVAQLGKRGLSLATTKSTRFILYWETDANDVDFHIQDARGNHAFYSHKQLASGGELYADVTTGYGPECFAIPGTPKAGPYHLSLDYYSQGPMGYGMGLLQIVRYDGKGKLTFQDRPYIIMADHAYVDLGSFQ